MAERLLVDTDVLIDYLRERAEAVEYFDQLAAPPLVSVITVAELYAGVREGAERVALDQFVAAFELIPVDRQIAVKGGLFRRDYRASHNIAIPDALIAATAEINKAKLVTLNQKHFPMLTDVIVPYKKP